MKDLKKLLKDGRDGLALGLHELGNDPAAVEHADGVPVAWRLFKLGENQIERFSDDGPLRLEVTPEMIAKIIERFEAKGSLVPLDSRHFLFHLAETLKVSEAEVALMLGDQATFGYGRLESRPDGLWIAGVEFVPLAKRLIAERVLRYFSPVIRGFASGVWRVTSVAFTNQPSLNGLDAIAADAAEAGNIASLTKKLDAVAASAKTKKEMSMKKLLAAVAGLIGMDAIALGADEDAPQDILDKLNAAKTELESGRALAKDAKDALGLAADTDPATVKGAILGLTEKAKAADTLKTRVDALELSAANAAREKLIEQGLKDGKLTAAMVEKWGKGLDAAALDAFLKIAPVVVPQGKAVDSRALAADGDAAALSAAEKTVAARMGLSEAEMLAAKKKTA